MGYCLTDAQIKKLCEDTAREHEKSFEDEWRRITGKTKEKPMSKSAVLERPEAATNGEHCERVAPCPGYLSVSLIKEKERRIGSLYMPDKSSDRSTIRVKVLAYGGPGPEEPDLNKLFPVVGHKAAISPYAGNIVEINNGEEIKVIRQSELLCLIGTE